MSQRLDTILQRNPLAQMESKHGTTDENLTGINPHPCYALVGLAPCKVGLTDTVSEENKDSVSSTVFNSWERFKGGLRRGLPEWSAEVVLDERPVRGVLEEIRQEGSLVENSGLVVPKPRYPPPRPASVPSTFSPNLVARCPKSLPKGDRRACSLSINNTNGIFPFPSDAEPAASPPASTYELGEFLQQDHPRSRNSPETWLPCPQIPRNNPIIPYFQEIAPRPKIPHLVNVTEQPRDSTGGGFPSGRGWWSYFYRGGGASSSHATAQNHREEATIRVPELALSPMGNDRWSMDVEAANTPHTPLTEKALMKHQRRLRYKARISKLRAALREAWGKFVDCFLLIVCAIWWFITGCGCGLFSW
ncbi:hypothetical protein B9Z19DRAFT_1061114 [Tuber borchii]|uniref:Uncharacterized protein n=1 Tax=Tuber borchii TaxID=42251 RepID=A0A2T7A6F9_TUBBO|nr:hypothetical protein B9Z19DRAFT_1061114 [Tuber borchii]